MRVALPLVGAVSGAPLVDGHARAITYLRVSLTDRCNYRCTYCMPEAGVPLSPKSEVLTLEEIARVVSALVACGVRRVRLTGGEPTVRSGLVELVARLSRLGLDDLALTTNGHVLAELADPLARAGLTRLNVSLDSLDAARFRAITRWGDLSRVLAGLDASRAAGFCGTKINTVALAGWNDDELPSLCRFAWERGMVPRFIEWMPMGEGEAFAPGAFLPASEMRRILERSLGRLAVDGEAARDLPGVGPARYLRLAAGAPHERLGIISAVTEPFCETCNRVRLSSTGQLHSCLARDEQVDLRAALRAAATDEELVAIVRGAAREKGAAHAFAPSGCGGPRKHMVQIGG